MPFLLFIIVVITAAGVWYWRIKQAGEIAGDLANAAQDVKNAARRFGFNRKKNVHPPTVSTMRGSRRSVWCWPLRRRMGS